MTTVTLDDKYLTDEGRVLISGIQALTRLIMDVRRVDRARGESTAAYVSGYQGSPLGGLDRELARCAERLDALDVVFQPGLNEELAATAVAGTQLLGELDGRRVDGVTGFWYGKNPGFDRAADAIRHGNVSGTAPLGGAVAFIGDDPSCKSSTIPSSCEPMCRSLVVPLLAPGSVAEILTLGLHAVALSREAGLWTGLKIVADVADATATVDVTGLLAAAPRARERGAHRPPVLLPPTSLDAEQDLLEVRLARVHDYARRHRLNRIAFEPARPRIGVVAAGTAFAAVRRGLSDLGLDDAALDALGVRLVRIGMPWPLGAAQAAELVAGLQEVVVVEDKLGFLEGQFKEALYRAPDAPLILGKADDRGAPLVRARGSVSSDDAALAIASRLAAETLAPDTRARLDWLRAGDRDPAAPLATRTPFFCSGCPHSTSTKAADDELVGVGIGCHTMVALEQTGRGKLVGMAQMGGEGAQWLGLAPFTADEHFVQNLGDGTFHHSGSLAIRAAVAAGHPITYKLLYNDAVAMTGGQRAEGRMDVPTLTRWLALEGVRRVVVTTDDPGAYRGVALDPIAQVRPREELADAMADLRAAGGVTVLIHDDRCATEERRLRKRGEIFAPAERVWINERVCEGCGDCGRKSTCLSVVPVQTDYGRKTQIHQASCSQDFSCLEGDCPSFVLVTPSKRPRTASPDPPLVGPPEPPRVGEDVVIRMPGIGGTGVVTVSQILQMAAHLDGRHAAGLEQTGLAQKGGPVVSDVRISDRPVEGALKAGAGTADVLLGFDMLGAVAAATRTVCDPERTVAVLNATITATARMVVDPAAPPVPRKAALRRIRAATRAHDLTTVRAQEISERLLGDHLSANMVLVGAALQHGCLPLRPEAIEEAIRLNGAAVEQNVAALRWGRAAIAAPDAVAAALEPATPARAPFDPVAELTAYQGAAYAKRFEAAVAAVAAREGERLAEPGPIAEAFARGLFKLMAYKDEYEVARLHLDAFERARLETEFGPGAKVRILLQPPLLRALGVDRKLRLGPWVRPLLGALRAGRRLRGTPLDPFGHTRVRRRERSLPAEYEALVHRALDHLTEPTASTVAEIAALPDVIRGYESVKLESVERYEARARALESALRAAAPEAPARPLALA